ncbi:hypothetical protein EZV62_014165 [Acer yangbiense]|uniref:Integrase catalytic domain-containing protein n=1 Tax=Acer yangbiense TaxID=1000413 RepID=A0A5C7HTR0_9ROSI|nr:hypothetical protein EZV62_014165 [Acer yangbiense]
MIRTQYNTVVRNIRSDNGSKYLSNEFRYELNKRGLLQQLTYPYTSEQNGVVECTSTLSGSIVVTSVENSSLLLRVVPIFEPSSPSSTSSTSRLIQFIFPRSVHEALLNPKWVAAIQVKIDAHQQNQTWKLVTLPTNLTFAVSVVSQFMYTSCTSHMDAVYYILRYLKTCHGLGLFNVIRAQSYLSCFTDVDYVGSKSDRRFTSGLCTFCGNHLISWKSRKQAVVSWSSVEAEYHTMT